MLFAPCVLLLLSILPVAASWSEGAQVPAFHLSSEIPLDNWGGIPFTKDLDGDGKSEVLWLQSPGIFHSKVFDKPPWLG